MAEVYVDMETGQVHLRKLNTVHDVATILNPVGHQGQIDGGIMQGVGYALMEEMVMEDGQSHDREPRRIQNTEHQGSYVVCKRRSSTEMSVQRRSRARKSVKAPSPKSRLPSLTLCMTQWACGLWICPSRLKRFFARCRRAGQQTRLESAAPRGWS